jgi:hypothetical protein
VNAQGQARGSSALRGVADISVSLKVSKQTGQVTLKSESRYDSVSLTGTLNRTGERWYYEQGRDKRPQRRPEPRGKTVDARLTEALAKAGPAGATYDQLVESTGLSIHQLKRRLPARRGKTVDARGEGKKGDPLRWYPLGNT